MPRDVSDEEYAYLQNRRMVADFVESIYNDPKLNKEAKRLIKTKYPNLQIPDFDIEEKVDQRFAAEKKTRDDADKEARQKKEDDEFKAARAKTQKQYGFTDEAMTKLEKMMVDRNIGNYEDAAELMAAREPKTSEPSYDSQFWNHEKAPGFAEIAKDPEAWGRMEIIKALRNDEQRAKQQGR
jgi:hypothetical protein